MTDSPAQEQHIAEVRSKIGKKEFIFLMGALMAINAIAIDIMLPAMDQIKTSLHAYGANEHQYIIFSYLVGYGISQLAFGPLTDRFGRRSPLIFGLFLYTITSFACAFAPSFAALLVLRAFQGIGAATTRVITISIIRDLYHGRRMAQVMSVVMMVFMIVPVIAPATGQMILFFGNWHVIFIFMAVAGSLIALWALLKLPETIFEKRPLTFISIHEGFKEVLTNRIALCYTLAFSVVLGALFGSLNTATQIYKGIYHLESWFPAAFATVALFQALSSFLNARFVGRFGMRKISHSLLLSFIGAALIWFVWSFIQVVPFPAYMVLFIIIMFSFGAMGANFNALAMEPLGKLAGTASSVFGFMQTIIGASLGIIVGQTFNGTTVPIAGGFLCFGLAALMLVLTAEKGKLFQPQHLPAPIIAETEPEIQNQKKAEK